MILEGCASIAYLECCSITVTVTLLSGVMCVGRYYWARDDLYIRAVNAEFLYGYEYLGNSGRLVITPLTDRCNPGLLKIIHLCM